MRTFPLLSATIGCVLFAGVEARASYMYDWSTVSGGTITLTSDHGEYQMKITDEPHSGSLSNSTDTTASQLSILPVANQPHGADTFHGAFNLTLVITDQGNGLMNDGKNGDPAPLVYHVSFTTTVSADGATSTSAVALQPTTNTIILGKDTFTVHLPSTGQWFVAPPTVGSINSGDVGLSIDFIPAKGAGGTPSPEPSSLVLAALGMSFAGVAGWRRKRRVRLTLDLA